MDVKKIAFIDILFFLYIVSLGFIRLGIPFLQYRFSLSELILVLIFLYYLARGFNRFSTGAAARNLIFCFIVFLLGMTLSFIGIKDWKAGLIEFSTYLYGLASMILFSLYINEKKEEAVRYIGFSCFSILLLAVLGSFLIFTQAGVRKLVLFNEWNYIFFMSMPNQLSIFIIICFNIILLERRVFSRIKYAGPLILFFLPLLFFVSVVLTGSRTGMVISAVLVPYSYYLLIKDMRKKRHALFLFLGAGVFLFPLFLFFKGSPHAGALLNRGLSVYQNIKAGSLIAGDVRQENFRDGINAFLSRPVTGVGLGNVWKNHSKWEIHNNFLSVLAETGLCGFIPFLLVLGYILFLILKSNRKQEYLIIYFSVLAYSMQHHILRERWFWLFFLFLVQHISMTDTKQAADSLPGGDRHGV